MAVNKYLLADRSKLLSSRLDQLVKKLQTSYGSPELQTKEEYLFEATKVINEFYKSLRDPQLDPSVVRADDYPDPSIYNTLWEQLLNDLTALFNEMEGLEAVTVSNFNFVITEANRLVDKMKGVSSKLGDYILYAIDTSNNVVLFKESFNNLNKIDFNSKLLNKEQCEISQEEGIATLPIDREKDSSVIVKESPVLNPASNGVFGNNQESGAVWNGGTEALFDNNPDTWTEYERVITGTEDDGVPLVLDLSINLGTPQIVNYVRVNPHNFGTRFPIEIVDIETSLDGRTFSSIKKEVPTAGFAIEDEERAFTLAPATSKFAGQGIYSFFPRKVKYIHFIFKQSEPYIITTVAGIDKLRYAIGIRDLEVKARVYKPEGEFVSTSFESVEELRKLILRTNQIPNRVTELAEIRYYISPNNGSSWFEILPEAIGTGATWRKVEQTGDQVGVAVEKVKELLSFNDTSTGSIETSVPVTSIRLKAQMRRDDTKFNSDSYTLGERTISTSEPHEIPSSSPFVLSLQKAPVEGTVSIVDPMFGSRGDSSSPMSIGFVSHPASHFKYRLPFSSFPRPVVKEKRSGRWYSRPARASEWMHIEVAGEEWSHITGAWNQYSSSDKVYSFDQNRAELTFGNGTNGKAPPAETKIDLYLDAERIFPSEEENNHIAQLDFSTSANKNAIKIKRYGEAGHASEVLPMDSLVIHLAHPGILDTAPGVIFGIEFPINRTRVDYINGKDELTESYHYSIDAENGIIYLSTTLGEEYSDDITVSYQYEPIYTLKDEDWSWGTTSIVKDSVSIKDSAWATISKYEPIVVSGNNPQKGFELSQLSVVKGTLDFETTSGNAIDLTDSDNPLLEEVDFVDGVKEFAGLIIRKVEKVPSLTVGQENNFDLQEDIVSDTNYGVSFSSSGIFTGEGAGIGSLNDGEYFVDRTNNKIYVQVAAETDTTETGTVDYFHSSPTHSNRGLYSVDYKLGKIYTQRPFDISWAVNARYDYTDFRAEYRIARLVDPKSYEVDISARKVTIKDDEVVKRSMIPQLKPDRLPNQYIINYDYIGSVREDIEALSQYFSPVLRDYAIKAIKKGGVF